MIIKQMDSESRIIGLQKIDCNCNDCKFMERDFSKFKSSLELHHKWQLDYFNMIKNNMIDNAKEWKLKGEFAKSDNILKEVKKLKFQFNKSSALINFGRCTKFQKDVSFIPNVYQLETQDCFEHRRSIS